MTLPIAPDDAPTVPYDRPSQPEPPDEETVVVEPGFRRLSDQQIATIIDMDKEASVRGARLDMALELQQRRAADLTGSDLRHVLSAIELLRAMYLPPPDIIAALEKVLDAHAAQGRVP